MRLWPKQKREATLAVSALTAASADLYRAEQKHRRATEIAKELKDLRMRNNFSPRIRAAYEETRR